MTTMIPCANPAICGVQNHLPGTQALCRAYRSADTKRFGSDSLTLASRATAPATDFTGFASGTAQYSDITGPQFEELLDRAGIEYGTDTNAFDDNYVVEVGSIVDEDGEEMSLQIGFDGDGKMTDYPSREMEKLIPQWAAAVDTEIARVHSVAPRQIKDFDRSPEGIKKRDANRK